MPDKRFTDPPITEVVCGILFEHVEGLDPVLVGRFWESQLGHFPRKQLLPAIPAGSAQGLVIDFSPVPPLRTWLISENDSRVMQVQGDRFYLNWRSRGAAYPSFNPSDGQEGLHAEVLRAFSAFTGFLSKQGGLSLRPTGVEMSMIDVLRKGRHWGSLSDLGSLVPSTKPLFTELEALPDVFQVNVEGPIKEGERRIAIQRAVMTGSGIDALRVDSSVRLPITATDQVDDALKRAHVILKRTFDELIPKSEHYRFETDWRPSP